MALHPQSRVLLDELGPPAGALTHDQLVATRAEARELARSAARVGLDHVADLDADGVPCRLYRPRLGAPVALYVHGGGWVMHDLETHDAFCRHLAHVTGWALLSVDYRLAPEHPHPAGLDDVETAARWLRREGREHRVETGWIPGIGDSAGANLVAGLAVREPTSLDALALLYPATDRWARLPVEEENAALVVDAMEWMWEAYAPGEAGERADVSVLHAPNLDAFPPVHLTTCEHDLLREQGEAFAAALASAGVEVTAQRALGMVHSFWRQPQRFDAARSLVVSVGAWLDALRERDRHA